MIKRKIICLCCVSAALLTGCSSGSGLLMAYSDMNMLKSPDVQDAMAATTVDAFTKNIAVISGDGSHGEFSASGSGSEEDSGTADNSQNTDGGSAGTDAQEPGTVSDDGTSPENNGDNPDSRTTQDNTETDVQTDVLSDTPALLVCKSTNEVLYYNDAFAQVPPASLTKLMTALLALKYGTLSEEVELTAEMNANMITGAQTCGFIAGDRVTLETLLKAMLVYSGNETANAIGINISGSLDAFAALMNEEAQKLGAVNTHFVNANGLDTDGHYSSAYDLYLIFNECMKYDVFTKAMETAELSITYTKYTGDTVSSWFQTTNYYLKNMAYSPEGMTVYGGKTGTTDNAGACLICYALDSTGKEYIAVSLGNSSKEELYSQMNKILSKIQN